MGPNEWEAMKTSSEKWWQVNTLLFSEFHGATLKCARTWTVHNIFKVVGGPQWKYSEIPVSDTNVLYNWTWTWCFGHKKWKRKSSLLLNVPIHHRVLKGTTMSRVRVSMVGRFLKFIQFLTRRQEHKWCAMQVVTPHPTYTKPFQTPQITDFFSDEHVGGIHRSQVPLEDMECIQLSFIDSNKGWNDSLCPLIRAHFYGRRARSAVPRNSILSPRVASLG